jgi:hypothetical protein
MYKKKGSGGSRYELKIIFAKYYQYYKIVCTMASWSPEFG